MTSSRLKPGCLGTLQPKQTSEQGWVSGKPRWRLDSAFGATTGKARFLITTCWKVESLEGGPLIRTVLLSPFHIAEGRWSDFKLLTANVLLTGLPDRLESRETVTTPSKICSLGLGNPKFGCNPNRLST